MKGKRENGESSKQDKERDWIRVRRIERDGEDRVNRVTGDIYRGRRERGGRTRRKRESDPNSVSKN